MRYKNTLESPRNEKMSAFWILILIFMTTYTVQPGRRWVTAQSLTEAPVYQPDKELSVNIGNSATLRCCVSGEQIQIIDWFKQPNREKPQIIVTVFKDAKETFYNGFQESRFHIERSSNCFNVTVLNIIQSDEAMYYCALTRPNTVFADGTYLKIKSDHVTIASETSKPALCDNSEYFKNITLHGNDTNSSTHEKTVFALGTALGLCVLLNFCLTCCILRRKYDKMDTSIESSPRKGQESGAETVNYAALQFRKRNAKAEKRKTGSDECVYSDVKLNIQHCSS
ncbi:uncharacterized protein LOC124625979 [Ictalurus punctatus]|uniref:Uncharacterized protein LOC124625979 n=1 Tax=Ictalurus punctatus TaxID=7998 RepID=A0A2D0RGY2_ICTPU|nr:uncharacterized protein LOC124625979 [Ictalurus punctatus]